MRLFPKKEPEVDLPDPVEEFAHLLGAVENQPKLKGLPRTQDKRR